MSVIPVNIAELHKIKIDPLPLPGRWRLLLGNLPRNHQWRMMVYGYSQSGKSSFVMKLANILSTYGTVLFNNAEESIIAGTISNRIRNLRISGKNIFFYENHSIEDLKITLRTGKYNFCIVDSVSALANGDKELLDFFHLPQEFPDVNFVFVIHGDKEAKNYLGPARLQNLVQLAFEIQEGKVLIKKNYFALSHAYAEKLMFDIFKN